MDKKYIFENYEVTLSKSDEGCLIQLDNCSSGTLFSKLITDQAAHDASNQSFDAETIYQMLKDFFDNKPEKVTLSFAPDGKLVYSCPILLGNIVRKTGFTFHLDKENLDPLQKMERLVRKLTDRVSVLEKDTAGQGLQKSEVKMKGIGELDQRFQRVEDKIQSIDDVARVANQLDRVEERCNKLEQLLTKKMSKLEKSIPENTSNESKIFHFNPDGPFASFYFLSDGNKTARAKTKSPYAIFAKEPIPKTERSTFSFLIHWYPVIIGIVRNDALGNIDCYSKPGTFAYENNGHFYKNGICDQKNLIFGSLPAFATEDKVSFTVNLETGEFLIKLNEKQVGFTVIPKDITQGNDFYPFLYTSCSQGTGATFVCEDRALKNKLIRRVELWYEHYSQGWGNFFGGLGLNIFQIFCCFSVFWVRSKICGYVVELTAQVSTLTNKSYKTFL